MSDVTVRLLLINPRFPESFWSFRWAMREVLPGARAVNPPLGLATLAALCPPHWQVSIVDENIEPLPERPPADLIGVCGMGIQFERQRELLRHYRDRGYPVIAGGSFASLCPERYAGVADSVIAGEAEHIFPRFCRDFEARQARPLYRETGAVDLADSPTPRFDLLKLERYSSATLQFSRGCPYRCEFCDIIVMFGRKPRTKPLAQVARELDALRAQGAANVFFVDDNLVGDRRRARELLEFLADYQARHRTSFRFGTEASINVAQDDELLALLRAAHFEWLFIGIESPDPETLRNAQKTQNTREDLLASIRRIYAHGIDVFAGFIVGFDEDTEATFEAQHRFIVASGIQAAMVGLLTALPHTPLHARLEREGRLREGLDASDNTRLATNLVPRSMSYEALVAQYRRLWLRLTSDAGIAARVRNKARYLRDPIYRGEYGWRDSLGIVRRFLVRGVLRADWRRAWHLARSAPWLRPRQWALFLLDWIAGLSLRDYVERHFRVAPSTIALDASAVMRALGRRLRRLLARRQAWIRMQLGERPRLEVQALSSRGARALAREGRRLERLLRDTSLSLHLGLEAARATERRCIERLLRRLARHGDRITLALPGSLRQALGTRLAPFNIVLTA